MAVRAIPPEYGAVTPFVIVRGAAAFLDYTVEVFGATRRDVVLTDTGTVVHGEVDLDGSIIMCFDARREWPPTPAFLMVYVDDCDATTTRAVASGGRLLTALQTTAWGDRFARVQDPFDNIWWIQTHIEDVPEDEMYARMAAGPVEEDPDTSFEHVDRALRSLGRSARSGGS